MPRPSKGPHLIWRENRQRWFIRDGEFERGTGCAKADRTGAEKKLATYINEKHRPDFGIGDPDQVRIANVLSIYAKEHAPTVQRPEMIGASVIHLGEFWAGKVVSQITKRTCREYETWRLSQPSARYKNKETAPRVGSQTARRELEDLRAALRYAKDESLLRFVPTVHLPDKSEPRDRWLRRDEAARLLWAAWKPCHGKTKPDGMSDAAWQDLKFKSRHLARFVLMGLYTGTRKGAMLKLRWMSNTEGGWIDLARHLIYRKGEGEQQTKKRRTPIPISDRLFPHLCRWESRSTTHVIEFEGLSIASVKRSWATAVASAGLSDDVVPHVLRHTFATWAVQGGMSFGLVAGALGTTERMVEQVYGHHAPDYLRGVVNAVGTRPKSFPGLHRIPVQRT